MPTVFDAEFDVKVTNNNMCRATRGETNTIIISVLVIVAVVIRIMIWIVIVIVMLILMKKTNTYHIPI